jgi:hypothetical protein
VHHLLQALLPLLLHPKPEWMRLLLLLLLELQNFHCCW